MPYSIRSEAKKILQEGILQHLHHRDLPSQCVELEKYITFTGSDLPSIPINWRFAESAASLKGFEAVLLNLLLHKKYGIEPQHISINTDHAQLYIMSALLVEIEPDENADITPTPIRELSEKYSNYFPLTDLYHMASSQYRRAVQNIHKTKDGQFHHVHGSLNPDPTLEALGMPKDAEDKETLEESFKPLAESVATFKASELDDLLGEKAKQAATICYTPEGYLSSEQGRANVNVGLYKLHHHPNSDQQSTWWKNTEQTSIARPLAGLKVVDLTRVIAGPAVGKNLAELGASVMRITSDHLPDFSGLHPDLNWGKWNCNLDFRNEADLQKLHELILDADVIVDGYRPRTLSKFGLSQENILDMTKHKKTGIIYVRENCFGWDGPLSHRSGWQPISDANSGISWGFGRAMGNDEPVTPVFPNSDYCTGIAGSCAVLQALIQRAELGGSYTIDLALNYYNAWLSQTVGTYPEDVWHDVWERNGRQVFRHWHSMNYTVPRYLEMLKNNSKETLLNPRFFETRTSNALGGLKLRVVKPVLQFPENNVKPGYNVGTRGNNVDKPYWPTNLMTEVVS